MKQLDVQIMGQGYVLSCPEGGEVRLLNAVERVDTAMCRIRDAGKVRVRERIAVLAALNLAFDLGDQAPATAPSPTQAPDASATPPPAGATGAALDQQVLASLLQRLDIALGDDAQLI